MDNWTNPRTLMLLGASSGFLDPRGGMSGGFQGAMQGLQAGTMMQQQRAQQEMAQKKAMRQIEINDYLTNLSKTHDASDPVSMGRALIGSGYQELIPVGTNLLKSKTAKSFLKGVDEKGKPAYFTGYSTGEVSPTGVTPAEKLEFQNLGNQTVALDPYTGQPKTSYAQGISPGQNAQLAQSQGQFNMSHALAQQNSELNRFKAMQPQLVDGAFVYPPSAQNPQGAMVKTDLFSAPKGSEAEKTKLSTRVKSTLGNDTEDLIKQATGSMVGSAADTGASVFGVTTPGAKANATLKIRAATLAGNMPRFEGPQSDADRKYYLEMAGDLANPSKTTTEKLMALKELRRMHNIVDDKNSASDSNGWNVQRID